MEKVLNEILKELKYQTKLMEYIYEKKDGTNKEALFQQMDNLKLMMSKLPGFGDSDIGKMVSKTMDVLKEG